MDNEVLKEVIRLSLRESLSSLSNGHHDAPPQGDSPRQKLVDGIFFSRKFILTYHAVIVSVVLLLSVSNWGQKYLRWRRKRASSRLSKVEAVEDIPNKSSTWTAKGSALSSDEASSSGSSTLEGTSSPPRKFIDEDEETPLLFRKSDIISRRSYLRLIKAFLMYQPPPIPFFNKTLPSMGSSIAISGFIGLNLFYCLYRLEFTPLYIFVIADRFGVVFIANLPLLYLFAAKNQPLKFLTGRSYESLNIFHRRLGELLCLLAVFHAIGMFIVWYTLIRPRGFTFGHFLLLPTIYLGLGAFFSYEFLYATSLGSFRQRWYELFLGLHVVLQISALIFLYLHHRIGQPYVLIALAIFAVDRLIYRLTLKSTTLTAIAKLMEDEETVKLTISVPSSQITTSHKLAHLLAHPITSGWKATDHVFITISALGKEHILQAHPFTISSAAPTSTADPKILELLIRSQTGFSRDLLHYVHRHNTLSLRLDGPYGSSHARDLLADSENAIVVAGGSGIAVAWPLIEYLINLSSTSSDPESTPTHNSSTRRKITLLWITHQSTHLSWLSKHDLEMAREKGVNVIIPKATEEAGRPNVGGLIKGVVENGTRKDERVGVVVSGPDGLGRGVRNTCAGLVREGRDVGVVVEKFGW